MGRKPSIGRQRIEIARIPNKNHLQVTFSKRRSGLFKKASELCTLCGVEVAIVVFSPADKVFSFGHPEVEALTNRFLTRNPPRDLAPPSGALHLIEAHRNATVHELNLQLTQVLNQLDTEKKRGEALEGMRKTSKSSCWWEAPIGELGLHELEQLRVHMEELKKNVVREANGVQFTDIRGAPSPFFMTNGMRMLEYPSFESKPIEFNATTTTSAISHVHNFGYGHEFF
ncbi:agamous-like MADS-box protein AGL62 [Malania oleifera]|uniref:agamous-like MADS-box protein AGL62 n=1 Tax=Malania oleifera TaxID=397392 RepID=UPI0025ADEDCA|nr:agamous-like MADS-box protein AGL62 [Malania oleifera]